MFNNDILKCSLFHTVLFADTSHLMFVDKDLQSLGQNVNHELNKTDNWLQINKQTLNHSNANYIQINKIPKLSANIDFQVTLNSNVIKL